MLEYICKIVLIALATLGLNSLFAQPNLQFEPTSMGTTTARVIAVIDGDTIDVVIGTSTNTTRVRYIGIDTPEPYAETEPECGSYEASARNKELVDEQIITLVPGAQAYDTYGRLLAYVYAGETFVNEELVSEGFATVMMIQPNAQHKKSFTQLFQNAQNEKLGIWATCY